MTKHVVIVGGGISGLAALERLAGAVRPQGALRVTLVDAASRLGGVIRTDREEGFVMEAGPDVMLAAKPAAVALCDQLGLAERIIETRPSAKGSFILDQGKLRRVPEGMSGVVPSRIAPFLRTPLLTPVAKLRVGLEYLIPPDRGELDETVEHFVVRRLGREMYDRLIEPLLSGIFAGDGARLSIPATFPQLVALEREHGGLIRGMLAGRRTRPAPPSAGHRRPIGLVSLTAGLGELVEAIERAVLSHPAAGTNLCIRRGVGVRRVERATSDGQGGYAVSLADGEVLAADAVVVAAPSHAAAKLLASADAALAALLGEIEHASTVTVNAGFREEDVPSSLAGTGYTVPRAQQRPVLACTFSSAKFAGRAPAGRALFRLFLGGAGRGDYVARSDEELTHLVRTELRDVLGITAEPLFVRINRFERVMPQYNVGHLARLSHIDEHLARLPGLLLAGNAYRGVGIPDCVRAGQNAAEGALRVLGMVDVAGAVRGARAAAPSATDSDTRKAS